MSDHILYKEETLSTAAAELERLASTMSVVTRQLDAVDTSDEWWEHIRGAGGESAVDRVRALRNTCDELDKQSTRLAGNVRKAIELYEQAEAKAARLCQIDGPASQPPYLDETTGAVAVGDTGESSWTDRVKYFIWDLLGDLIGDSSTFLDYATDIMEQVGMIGKGLPFGIGYLTSALSSFFSNLQDYVSADGAMPVQHAVGEFLVELGLDVWFDSVVGLTVLGLSTVCPVAAIVVGGVWAVYNLTIGDEVTEFMSDAILYTFGTPHKQPEMPSGQVSPEQMR